MFNPDILTNIGPESRIKSSLVLRPIILHNQLKQQQQFSEWCMYYCFFPPQPTNHMNSSLASLYRKGNPDSSASSPRREQPAANSPVSVVPTASSAGTAVSTGGWFIDKGPRHEKNNVIDLCDDQPINTMANVRQVTHTGKQPVLKARHWVLIILLKKILYIQF